MEQTHPDFGPPRPPLPPLPPAKGMVWPTVIGIIAIVFGGGGVMTGVLGLLGPVFNRLATQFSPPEQAAMYEAQRAYQWWTVGLCVLATVVALWLLFGGIGLLKQRRSAVSKIRTWAVMKILLTFVMAVFQGLMQRDMLAAMQQQPSVPAMPAAFSSAMVGLFILMTVLWGIALPVFMLVWFARKKITAEVRTWEDEPGRD